MSSDCRLDLGGANGGGGGIALGSDGGVTSVGDGSGVTSSSSPSPVLVEWW